MDDSTTAGAGPAYLEITFERALRIWWAAAWRGIIYSTLAGAVVGGIEGAFLHTLRFIPLSVVIVNIPIGFLILRTVLRKPFSEFSIRLVASPRQGRPSYFA
jgi:hypothetical protein